MSETIIDKFKDENDDDLDLSDIKNIYTHKILSVFQDLYSVIGNKYKNFLKTLVPFLDLNYDFFVNIRKGGDINIFCLTIGGDRHKVDLICYFSDLNIIKKYEKIFPSIIPELDVIPKIKLIYNLDFTYLNYFDIKLEKDEHIFNKLEIIKEENIKNIIKYIIYNFEESFIRPFTNYKRRLFFPLMDNVNDL